MNELALVLSDSPGDEESLGRIGAVITHAASQFVFSHGEERSPDVNEYVWFGSREGDEISVLDDFALNVRYVTVRSARVESARATRAALTPLLNVVPTDELVAAARDPEDPAALVRLAIGVEKLDEESAAIIASKLDSLDRATRFHAVAAASMSGSPYLCEPLERARVTATDERQMQLLDLAISSCCRQP